MQTHNGPWFMFEKAVADRLPPQGPPELAGSAFIVNSATHKYVQPRQESDRQALVDWGAASQVTSQQVTQDCGLAVPVDAWVEAELRDVRAQVADPAPSGLGDRVSAVLRFLGFSRSCAGCERRRTWLNRL